MSLLSTAAPSRSPSSSSVRPSRRRPACRRAVVAGGRHGRWEGAVPDRTRNVRPRGILERTAQPDSRLAMPGAWLIQHGVPGFTASECFPQYVRRRRTQASEAVALADRRGYPPSRCLSLCLPFSRMEDFRATRSVRSPSEVSQGLHRLRKKKGASQRRDSPPEVDGVRDFANGPSSSGTIHPPNVCRSDETRVAKMNNMRDG
jgi:hypothetical protein